MPKESMFSGVVRVHLCVLTIVVDVCSYVGMIGSASVFVGMCSLPSSAAPRP